MYNMYQAIDDCKAHDLLQIVDLKIYLIKLNIIIRYIDLFNVETDGIISEVPDGCQIINNIKYINRNVISTIDFEFKKFINQIGRFRMHPYFDLNLKNTVYPVEQNDSNVISLDSERIVKFVITPIPALHEENYNELLVVACLKTYFGNAVQSSKHSLNNIYKHIQIIVIVTKFQFINKKYLKITLKNLVHKQYIDEYAKHNYTLYKQADNKKIDLLISKFRNIGIINSILNLTKEKYLSTSVKYELSTSVYEYTTRLHNRTETQENKIMGNIQEKVVFIKKMLNSITESQQTTIKTIHNTYTTKLTAYKQLLNTTLNSSPKSTIDYSFTTDELLQNINNSNLQLPSEPMTRTIPPTPPSKNLEQLQTSQNKFYPQR
ncbi:uncharacterized protein LOC132925457 [Rhopalosiphum padi]|uniref:uncharacterized protein LOC132925457 n=1 Tax=Rhopalosiphum padi TaxID=40932 RepID=UPI00298E92B5|nr:uncharacterized protein LOC132925457 [Rhopalosiphum padi]